MRILVTAGPTREHLDDVRFLSSPSSGRMGFAVATAAARRDHDVALVTGPVERDDPTGVAVVRVTSALEMLEACRDLWPERDALVMTASVSDWRPAERLAGKPRRDGAARTIALVPNPDIVADLAAHRRPGQRVVGFALQVDDPLAEAERKLREKSLDAIVVNTTESFGAPEAGFTLIVPGAPPVAWGRLTKDDVAERILDWLETAP